MVPVTYTNHAIGNRQVLVYTNSSCNLDMVHRLHTGSQHNAHGTILLGASGLLGMRFMVDCQCFGFRELIYHLLPGKPIGIHIKKSMHNRPDTFQNAHQLCTINQEILGEIFFGLMHLENKTSIYFFNGLVHPVAKKGIHKRKKFWILVLKKSGGENFPRNFLSKISPQKSVGKAQAHVVVQRYSDENVGYMVAGL